MTENSSADRSFEAHTLKAWILQKPAFERQLRWKVVYAIYKATPKRYGCRNGHRFNEAQIEEIQWYGRLQILHCPVCGELAQRTGETD